MLYFITQEFVIEAVEKKQVFLRSCNIPKYIVADLSMVERQKQPPEVFTGKQLYWSLCFIKLPAKMFKNNYFEEYQQRTTASEGAV